MTIPAILRERDPAILVGAVGVSTLGDFLAVVPLALLVEERTGSSLWVSAFFIALWAPAVVLAGPVGALVDRAEAVRLVRVVALLLAAVCTTLAATPSTIVLLGATVVLGAGLAIVQAAEFALVGAAAGPERVQTMNGYVETSRATGFMLGPLAGGALAASFGTAVPLLLDAASFVAVAIAFGFLRVGRPPARDGGVRPRWRDGVAVLFGSRSLRIAMVAAFGSLLFMSMSIPAELLYVGEAFDARAHGYGLILTAWAAGMVLATNAVVRRVPPRSVLAAALVAVALQGAAKLPGPLLGSLAVMAVCYVGGGAAHGVKNTLLRTVVHHDVAPALHGRAFAAYNGLRNAAELGALTLGGVAVAALGARTTLLLAAAGSAAVGVTGLVAARARRA